MGSIDWVHVRRACRRQLRIRGVDDVDRTADAVLFVVEQLKRKPATPLALTIWRAAGWVAEGRSPVRSVPHGYIDAINPLDSRKRRAAVEAERVERIQAQLRRKFSVC